MPATLSPARESRADMVTVGPGPPRPGGSAADRDLGRESPARNGPGSRAVLATPAGGWRPGPDSESGRNSRAVSLEVTAEPLAGY